MIPGEDTSSGGSRGDSRRELFQGATTREILHRLWDGDPLGLWDMCAARIGERALLLDAARLHTVALAYVARDGLWLPEDAPLDPWLVRRIDSAIEIILSDDRAADLEGLPVDEAARAHHAFLCEVLELPPVLGRKACVVFNSLPDRERHALWDVLVEGRSIAQHAARTGQTPARVRRNVEEAIRTVASLSLGGGASPPSEGGTG